MASNITAALEALGPGPWRAASCESGGEDDLVLDSGGLYSARCACASSAKHLADILNYAREAHAREQRLAPLIDALGDELTAQRSGPWSRALHEAWVEEQRTRIIAAARRLCLTITTTATTETSRCQP